MTTTIFLNGVTVATIWNSRKLKEVALLYHLDSIYRWGLSNGIHPHSVIDRLLAGDFIGRKLYAYIHPSRKTT